MQSALLRARIFAVSLTLLSTYSLAIPAYAGSNKKEKTAPSGTLLIPLSPRMDDGTNAAPPLAPVVNPTPPKPRKIASKTVTPVQAAPPQNQPSQSTAPSTTSSATTSAPEQTYAAPTDPAVGRIDGGAGTDTATLLDQPVGGEALDPLIDENSLLKGTVQIVADDTEYDQEKNTFLGTGNAVAVIAGQNSRLEADTILYDQNSETIDARGNVKILRDGQLTTGSSFKFKVNSDEYLITDPDTELQGTQIVARQARGNGENLVFKNGQFTLPEPVRIANNAFNGPMSQTERSMESKLHPDAYLPPKPSFTFSARKMVYERYKEDGNLTIFGGRLKFKHFTVPMPKFNATVSADSRVVFPVTPVISNNYNVGGINIGPQFNYAVGKRGVFSWAPLVQIGGRSVYDTTMQQNNGKLGAGFRLGYKNDRLQAHLAYGSVSNLLVGDFKYRFNEKTQFQSGINRFLNDGMFGMRRARLLAEMVDYRYVQSIPYVSMLMFRTSGGWAQDQPQLVDLQGDQYSQLFKTGNSTQTKSAFRLQEQVTVISHPIFAVGNEKYGAKLNLYSGGALRLYSTGNGMAVGQFGPILTFKADRARLQLGYTQSGVAGKSPFVFDQFIQGQRSVSVAGDVRLSKWLTLGGSIGYNLVDKMMYSRGITAAIGPEDFKILLSRDTISGINRFGFEVLSGQPVKFNKLIMKGGPDAGQLGGGI